MLPSVQRRVCFSNYDVNIVKLAICFLRRIVFKGEVWSKKICGQVLSYIPLFEMLEFYLSSFTEAENL